MKIKSSIVQDFGGFELDGNRIGTKSVSRENVELPYGGPLPENWPVSTETRIIFNVRPQVGANVVLASKCANGKEFRRPLEISNQEASGILDDFFHEPCNSEKTGLDLYWLGMRHADYISWRKIIKSPEVLAEVLKTLDKNTFRRLCRSIEPLL